MFDPYALELLVREHGKVTLSYVKEFESFYVEFDNVSCGSDELNLAIEVACEAG